MTSFPILRTTGIFSCWGLVTSENRPNNGKITIYKTPTPRSGPRRGMMDAQDRLWFGENNGDGSVCSTRARNSFRNGR